MRVAIIADSHFTERSRFDECVRIHDWIAADIDRQDVDLIVHTGDVYDAKSTPAERLAVSRWVRVLGGLAPVVIVRGNHDAIGDLPLLARLRTKHPVIVEERAALHRVETRAGVVDVAAIAWPQAAYLAALAPGVDAGDALRAVLRGLGGESSGENVPRLLASHAMVRGSRTSLGQPLVGCDMEIGLEDLALARPDLAVLGHIHMPQSWEVPVIEDLREESHDRTFSVIYPGSPRRTAFGETEAKGYLLAELSRGEVPGWTVWQRIETPCAPMHLVTANWIVNEVGWGDAKPWTGLAHDGHSKEMRGAEVRLRYVVQSDQRDAARVAASHLRDEWLAAGAIVVKVEEEVIATSSARAPEIASATTIAAKLEQLWITRGEVPPPARAARLASMATALEVA